MKGLLCAAMMDPVPHLRDALGDTCLPPNPVGLQHQSVVLAKKKYLGGKKYSIKQTSCFKSGFSNTQNKADPGTGRGEKGGTGVHDNPVTSLLLKFVSFCVRKP